MATSLRRQWFQPGDGIAREVITADIQRYLGPDALVKPGKGTGEYNGTDGYYITAYRALTTEMVNDLKLDSQRWLAEDQQRRGSGPAAGSALLGQPDRRLGTYTESTTHRTRQYYGPTQPVEYPSQQYATSAAYRTPAQQQSYESTYTHTSPPPAGYVYSDGRYVPAPNHVQGPRTQPPYTYAQPTREGETTYYPTQQADGTRYPEYTASSAPSSHTIYAQQSTTPYYQDPRQPYQQSQTRRH